MEASMLVSSSAPLAASAVTLADRFLAQALALHEAQWRDPQQFINSYGRRVGSFYYITLVPYMYIFILSSSGKDKTYCVFHGYISVL
jgi:hypothetical protein